MEKAVRLLVAEDERHIARNIGETLRSAGYSTIYAYDGEEALRLLEDGEPPDLILTDLAMPRVDGMMLVDRLRENERLADIPVVMMWVRSSANEEQTIRWRDAHVRFWIMKPFQSEDVLRKTQEALHSGRSKPDAC